MINPKLCMVTYFADNLRILLTSYREVLLDSIFIDRLVNILKSSYPNFQRKAASILEFVTFVDPSLETIMSLDIESGLDAVFRQKVLEGMANNLFCCKTEFICKFNPISFLKEESCHG